MIDYTYYHVSTGSRAAAAIQERIDSLNVRTDAAKDFMKRWVGEVPYELIATDTHVVGFRPEPRKGAEFYAALEAAGALFVEDRKAHCVRPRAAGPSNQKAHGFKKEWDSLPASKSIAWLSVQLFGMDNFLLGMTGYSIYLTSFGATWIAGCPWLGTQGCMTDWRGHPFRLADGLVPLPYEEAMHIIHAERIRSKAIETNKEINQ